MGKAGSGPWGRRVDRPRFLRVSCGCRLFIAHRIPSFAPQKLCLSMAILGQFPPNLVFLIGILRPVRWTVRAARPWSRSAGAPAAKSPTRSTSERTCGTGKTRQSSIASLAVAHLSPVFQTVVKISGRMGHW